MSRRRPLALAAGALAAAVVLIAPGAASAAVDPVGCTPDLKYDPTVPTFQQVLGRELGRARPVAARRPPPRARRPRR